MSPDLMETVLSHLSPEPQGLQDISCEKIHRQTWPGLLTGNLLATYLTDVPDLLNEELQHFLSAYVSLQSTRRQNKQNNLQMRVNYARSLNFVCCGT